MEYIFIYKFREIKVKLAEKFFSLTGVKYVLEGSFTCNRRVNRHQLIKNGNVFFKIKTYVKSITKQLYISVLKEDTKGLLSSIYTEDFQNCR